MKMIQMVELVPIHICMNCGANNIMIQTDSDATCFDRNGRRMNTINILTDRKLICTVCGETRIVPDNGLIDNTNDIDWHKKYDIVKIKNPFGKVK